MTARRSISVAPLSTNRRIFGDGHMTAAEAYGAIR
jgi:hypothetical protein